MLALIVPVTFALFVRPSIAVVGSTTTLNYNEQYSITSTPSSNSTNIANNSSTIELTKFVRPSIAVVGSTTTLNYNEQYSITSTPSSNSTNIANNSSTIELTKLTRAPIKYILSLCDRSECPIDMVQKVKKRIFHWCSYTCECAKGFEMKGFSCQKPITSTELMTIVPKIVAYVRRSCGVNMIQVERCNYHPISGFMRNCQEISKCACENGYYFISDGLCSKMRTKAMHLALLAKQAKIAIRI
ncbi:unnamed protein product [Dracunculus medinensis]|uniref:EGF-like domain-containing protein n=1 Tax=Dracunculus medinensis TaxID=318479 RepID=A0A0N4UPF7_DRAME|nr:unnamed protein product [Dracunculus medinensis]